MSNDQPIHNTLWRFDQAHLRVMRTLIKWTVGTAVVTLLTADAENEG